jgi:hypothetical protein
MSTIASLKLSTSKKSQVMNRRSTSPQQAVQEIVGADTTGTSPPWRVKNSPPLGTELLLMKMDFVAALNYPNVFVLGGGMGTMARLH